MAGSLTTEAMPAGRCMVSHSKGQFFSPPRKVRDTMSFLVRCSGIGLLFCTAGIGPAAAAGWQHIGNVQRVEKLPDGVELIAGSAKLRITAFRDGVIRVRLAPGGSFEKDF